MQSNTPLRPTHPSLAVLNSNSQPTSASKSPSGAPSLNLVTLFSTDSSQDVARRMSSWKEFSYPWIEKGFSDESDL